MDTEPDSIDVRRDGILSRLSSGTKMMFIMTAALMPLGLIALFASIQSAHGKRLQHEADARIIATAEARQIELTVMRSANIVRLAAAGGTDDPTRCRLLLADAVRVLHGQVRIAFFAPGGRLRCATAGFTPGALPRPRGHIGIELLLLDPPGGVRFTVDAADGAYGVGELPARALGEVGGLGVQSQGVSLIQGATRLELAPPPPVHPLDQRVTVIAPIAGGQINLVSTSITSPVSAIEVLLVLLPLLMWAAAAVIGWVVINELLLRPLGRLQRAVAVFGQQSGTFLPPRLQTPAREIQALADSFADAAAQIAQRERALEEGLSHQVRLTREVHHRVKNNLQVVSSLINLHARGTNGEVASAYASIQRRVDALAVVHRNHYAELEENRGVSLRALIAELTSNLRATAPAAAQHFAITLDMTPAHVSQDVAVPVAFLVTDIVELAMDCAPTAGIEIMLSAADQPGRATLSIIAPGLASAACLEYPSRERFERIVTGLARQLRAPLERDDAQGRYSIALTVAPEH